MSALTTDESYLSFFYLITGAGFWLKSHLIHFLCKTWCRPRVTTAQLRSSENKQQIDQRMHRESFGVHNAPSVGLRHRHAFYLFPSSGAIRSFEDQEMDNWWSFSRLRPRPALASQQVSHSPAVHAQPVALRKTQTSPETHRWLKKQAAKAAKCEFALSPLLSTTSGLDRSGLARTCTATAEARPPALAALHRGGRRHPALPGPGPRAWPFPCAVAGPGTPLARNGDGSTGSLHHTSMAGLLSP